MDDAVGARNFILVDSIWRTRKNRGSGTCFCGHQKPGSRIPGFEMLLPEAVKTAAGHVAKIQGCRSQSSDPLGGPQASAETPHQWLEYGLVIVGKSGDQQAIGKYGGGGYENGGSIELGPLILDSHEQFAQKGRQDESGQYAVIDRKSDGDTEQRQVVGKVGGAVQRIDDPSATAARMCPALFSQDGVVGKGLGDGVDDGRFGLDVSFGDQIDSPFFADRSKSAEMLPENLAAVAGSSDPHTFDPFYVHKRVHRLQIFGTFCQLNCQENFNYSIYNKNNTIALL